MIKILCSNIFNYIKLFFFLVFTFAVWNCHSVPDGPSVILSYTHLRGSPLDYQFTIEWGNITDGYSAFLKVMPGPSNFDHQDWFLGNGNSSGTGTNTYTFPQDNPSPTSYIVYGEIRDIHGNILKQSPQSSITITYRKFKIIQLAMTNDDLFPNYDDNQNNIHYNGYNQLNMAFGDANTVINIDQTRSQSNLSNTTQFARGLELFSWIITNAGGDPLNANAYGLSADVAIICGIQNVPNGIPGITPALVQAQSGSTELRTGSAPPISYIRYDRIRENFQDPYDRVRVMVGAAIHELGHARGILADDPNTTHCGSHSDDCVMRNIPWDIQNYTHPTFCDCHIQVLELVIW